MKKYILMALFYFLIGGYSYANSNWSFFNQEVISRKQNFNIRKLDSTEKELLTKDGPYLGDMSGDNLYLVTTKPQANGSIAQFIVNLYSYYGGPTLRHGYIFEKNNNKFYLKYRDNQTNKWIILDSSIQFFEKINEYDPIDGTIINIDNDITKRFIGSSKYCYLDTGNNLDMIQVRSHVSIDKIKSSDQCNTKYITIDQQGFTDLGNSSYYFENPSTTKWFGGVRLTNGGYSGPGVYLKQQKGINGLIINWFQGNKHDDIVYSDELSGYKKGDVISFGIGSGSTDWYQIRRFTNKNSIETLKNELRLSGCILNNIGDNWYKYRATPNHLFQKEIDLARSKERSGKQLTTRENKIVGSMGPFVCPYIVGWFSELGSGIVRHQDLKQVGAPVGEYIESVELK